MYIRYKFYWTLFTCFLFYSMLQAQMVGTPVASQGQGEWSLACGGSFMTQLVGNETAYSQRWLVKSTYGIMPWMDFVATIGMANLKLDSPESDIQDLKSKPQFAFGAGLTFTIKHDTESQPFGLYAGVHFLRFPAKGIFQETAYVEPPLYFYRERQMEYDWRETMFFGGYSYRIGRLKIYGCGIGWSVSRLEKLMVYEYETVENKVFKDEYRAEYQSELWTGALAGIEVSFPKTRHVLSFEGLFYNTQYFVLMVGIGQTGILGGGW